MNAGVGEQEAELPGGEARGGDSLGTIPEMLAAERLEAATLRREARRRRLAGGFASIASASAVLAALLAIWQLVVDVTHISSVELVAPSAVFSWLLAHPGYYVTAAGWTLEEAGLGFVLAFAVAIVSAVAIVHSRLADRALSPLITVLQVTPILVLAPPLVLAFGIGIAPRVVEAALITFVPLARNAVEGFGSVDPETLELLRSVEATRRQVFRAVRLPNSVPHLVTGIKICAPLALIGAVVSEFTSSSGGLGYIMINASAGGDNVPAVYAAVFVLMFLGVVILGVVNLASARALRWRA